MLDVERHDAKVLADSWLTRLPTPSILESPVQVYGKVKVQYCTPYTIHLHNFKKAIDSRQYTTYLATKHPYHASHSNLPRQLSYYSCKLISSLLEHNLPDSLPTDSLSIFGSSTAGSFQPFQSMEDFIELGIEGVDKVVDKHFEKIPDAYLQSDTYRRLHPLPSHRRRRGSSTSGSSRSLDSDDERQEYTHRRRHSQNPPQPQQYRLEDDGRKPRDYPSRPARPRYVSQKSHSVEPRSRRHRDDATRSGSDDSSVRKTALDRFSGSDLGLGAGALGFIAGGLAAQTAAEARGRKHAKDSILYTLLGATVAGLGANALAEKWQGERRAVSGDEASSKRTHSRDRRPKHYQHHGDRSEKPERLAPSQTSQDRREERGGGYRRDNDSWSYDDGYHR